MISGDEWASATRELPFTPRCPECASEAWSQIDNGPVKCMRCETEWLVSGMHAELEQAGVTTLWLNHVIPEKHDSESKP